MPQTSQTDLSGPDASPQANLAAFGTSSGSGNGFIRSFTEHCLILGLCTVRATDLNYFQGSARQFNRETRWDFYWPDLSGIGEQEILNKEIYSVGTGGDGLDDEPFGYAPRYDEYRFKGNVITGQMRGTHPLSLDTWHLAQHFEERPLLNQTFIEEHPPIERIVAVQDSPHLLLDMYFSLKHVRPLPTFGVPGLRRF